jgi:hypothetical protein
MHSRRRSRLLPILGACSAQLGTTRPSFSPWPLLIVLPWLIACVGAEPGPREAPASDPAQVVLLRLQGLT